jgi:hypothetical protein
MRQGFMRHERLSLYNALINDEVRKHIKIWCREDKVDLFKSVSQLVTSINIRCVLGDDAYHAHAEEIASIYYQLELSGTTSHWVVSLVVMRVSCRARVVSRRWSCRVVGPNTGTDDDSYGHRRDSVPQPADGDQARQRKGAEAAHRDHLHRAPQSRRRPGTCPIYQLLLFVLVIKNNNNNSYYYLLLF